MIVFEHPVVFIIAIVSATTYFIISLRKSKKLYIKHNRFYNPLIKYVEYKTGSRTTKTFFEQALVALSIFLVISALANPYLVITEYKTVNIVAQANLRIKVKPAIVLIIDTSGSMYGEKIEEAKQALTKFVEMIDGKADIGLISFASTVKTAIPPTGDTGLIINAINRLKAVGGTMYQYPLTTALNWLKTYRYFNVSAYVVFASDGLPADLPMAEDIVKQFASLGIPIYTIFIGKSNIGYKTLEEIARETHGKCFRAKNAAEIMEKYIEAAKDVKTSILRSVNVTVTDKIRLQKKLYLSWYFYVGGLTAYILAIIISYKTRRITY